MTPTPLVPRGPWTDRAEVERLIGPLRLVCHPTPAGLGHLRRSLRGNLAIGFLLAGVPFLLALLALPTLHGSSICIALFLLVLGVGLAVANVALYRFHLARSTAYLLLGEHGLAIWSPAATRLVLWADLGIDWRACVEIRERDRKAEVSPILLKLQHADGGRFYLTEFYADVARVVAVVRRELRQASQRRPPPTTLLPDAIRTAPGVMHRLPPPPARLTPDADGPAGIGPIESISRVRWTSWLMAGIVLLMLGNVGLFPLLLVAAAVRCAALPFALEVVLLASLPGWWLLWIVHLVRRVNRELLLSARWLLGEHGLAYADGATTRVILWDEIGTVWRVLFLEHDGIVFTSDAGNVVVPPACGRMNEISQRVRAEVARRHGPDSRMLRVHSTHEAPL